MSIAFDFTKAANDLSTSDTWRAIARFRGETYPNQLRPEGDGVIVVFPDHSSVFVNYLNDGAPRIEMRSA